MTEMSFSMSNESEAHARWRAAVAQSETTLGFDQWRVEEDNAFRLVREESGHFVFRSDLIPMILLNAHHLLISSPKARSYLSSGMRIDGDGADGERIYFTVGLVDQMSPAEEVGALKKEVATLKVRNQQLGIRNAALAAPAVVDEDQIFQPGAHVTKCGLPARIVGTRDGAALGYVTDAEGGEMVPMAWDARTGADRAGDASFDLCIPGIGGSREAA